MKIYFLLAILSCNFSIENLQLQQSSELKKKIDDLGERYTELGRFSGSILVSKKGKLIYYENFGLADYENQLPFTNTTSFEVGEISRLFSEAILRKLIAEERLDPNKKLSFYLPDFQEDLNVDQFLKEPVTISPAKSASEISFLLIERISKKGYAEELQVLAAQLGLENTYTGDIAGEEAEGYLFHNFRGEGLELEKAAKGTFSPNLKTTPTDLLKLVQHLPKRHFKIEGYLEDGGFSFSVLNTAELNIIILSNRRHPVAGEMTGGIKAILEGSTYALPLSRSEIKVAPALLKEYAGKYSLNPEMQLQVVSSNDSLFVLMGPQKVHLKPQSNNQFFMEHGDSAIRFMRNSEGNVSSAELLDGFLRGKKIQKID